MSLFHLDINIHGSGLPASINCCIQDLCIAIALGVIIIQDLLAVFLKFFGIKFRAAKKFEAEIRIYQAFGFADGKKAPVFGIITE